MANINELQRISTQLRRDIVRMVTNAKSGHPGGSMSSADFLTALYFDVMKHDPATWTRSGKDQDVFILSAGHLTPIYYSLLARTGYFPVSELATFRQFGSRLQGHPSIAKGLPGVFQPSGSLGQGLSLAAGIAVAKKMDNEANKVYVMMGDGECEEGQIWEAAMFASHYKLDNLCLIVDWNGLQIDGTVEEVMNPTPHDKKLEAFGFHVISIDGHDLEQIAAAFAEAKTVKGKPTAIIAKTIKGKGVSFMEDQVGWHGSAPNDEQYEKAVAEIKAAM